MIVVTNTGPLIALASIGYLGLQITGTLGILAKAKATGLIDSPPPPTPCERRACGFIRPWWARSPLSSASNGAVVSAATWQHDAFARPRVRSQRQLRQAGLCSHPRRHPATAVGLREQLGRVGHAGENEAGGVPGQERVGMADGDRSQEDRFGERR